jgi:hypothetical protein
MRLEYARQDLKRMVDDESAFCSRVAEQPANALDWFYRMRDKQSSSYPNWKRVV